MVPPGPLVLLDDVAVPVENLTLESRQPCILSRVRTNVASFRLSSVEISTPAAILFR